MTEYVNQNRAVAFTAKPTGPTRMQWVSTATTTIICLHCRKAASSLPCSHRKLRCQHARAPRRTASDKAWRQFVKYLNRVTGSGACRWEDGERITGQLTLPPQVET